MEGQQKKEDKRYCGTSDICYYKNHWLSRECLAYKLNKAVWRTCPHKWKPRDRKPKRKEWTGKKIDLEASSHN